MAEQTINDYIESAIEDIEGNRQSIKRSQSDDELDSASDGDSSNVSEYVVTMDDELNSDSDYDVSEFLETEMSEGTLEGAQLPTEAQQQLNTFWPKVTEEIRNLTQTDLSFHWLPLARIKRIMELDEEKKISTEVPGLFSKAIEIFITELALRAWIHTEDNKRKAVQRDDIAMAVANSDQFDFLIDLVSRDKHYSQIGLHHQSSSNTTPTAATSHSAAGTHSKTAQWEWSRPHTIPITQSSPSPSPLMEPIFYNGQDFNSYKDICAAKEMYEKQGKVTLVEKSCRRISEDAHKNTINTNQKLIYSEISYSCIHNGDYKEEKISSESDKDSELDTYNVNKRRKTSIYKWQCPFKMDLYLSKDGQTLVVSNLQGEHNHIYHSSLYDKLPQQRQLDTEHLEKTKRLLALNVDKKVLKQHFYSKRKMDTTKNTCNLRRCIKRKVILTPDQNILTMAKEDNSSTVSQDKASTIDLIFDYVIHKKYASGMSKNGKANLRRLSKFYVERNGQLYYRHRAKKVANSGNEYRELLIIRSLDEQRHIIKSMHMGPGDTDAAPVFRSHLGIERTRAKILESFYWKNVGGDVKKFILACDHCQSQRVNPVHKTGVGKVHSVSGPSQAIFQSGVDITNLPKTKCVSQNKPDKDDLILVAGQNILTMAEESNSSTVLHNKADNIDLILKADQHFSIAEEHNSSAALHNKVDNIDLIFDYVVNNKFAPGMSTNDKGNLRKLSKHYTTQNGQLYYRHRAKKGANSEYREVLVIRDQDEQRHIIKRIHMGSGDIDAAPVSRRHLGITQTRVKILESFYWKNVGGDVKEFILACDQCQSKKDNHIHKADGELHPVPVPSEVMVQIGADIINLPKTERVSQNKPDKVDLDLKANKIILTMAEECNSSTVLQGKADNIDPILKDNQLFLTMTEKFNSNSALQDKVDNIDLILKDDQHHLTMAKECSSSTLSQNKANTIDLIFDYVVNKKYASGMSTNDKTNLRRLSKLYVARNGQLYYRYSHNRAKKGVNSGNDYREVLIIRDRDEQRLIIKRMHMGSGDIDAAPVFRGHLGIERTRAKILESFYWKTMSKDIKKFILACDQCQSLRVNNIHKADVDKHHPVPMPSEVQIDADNTNQPKTVCVSENKPDKVYLNLKADQNILTMPEECNSSTVSQDKADNIDLIFDFVVNKKYAPGMSINDKGNLRKLSKRYFAKKGKLYYLHTSKYDRNSGNEHREVLVIRDQNVQKYIIKSIHMGSGDSDTARCLGSHLGIERTRTKILERFYWKSVGRDVREFILACDRCQIVNPVHKIK